MLRIWKKFLWINWSDGQKLKSYTKVDLGNSSNFATSTWKTPWKMKLGQELFWNAIGFFAPLLNGREGFTVSWNFRPGQESKGNIFEVVKDLLNYDVFLLNNLVKWQHWWQHSLCFYTLLHSTRYRTSTECLPSLNCQAFLLFPFNNYKQTNNKTTTG